MQLNPKLIKTQFEKSMAKYDENALVQQLMAEKLVKALINCAGKNFANILELGAGTGLLTKQLTGCVNYKKYYANDLVEKSGSYLKSIVSDCKFICGNAQKIKTSSKMDLIISNAMFQWFSNLEKVLGHYRTILNPAGTIAFSTFAPDNFKEIKSLTGLALDYKEPDEIRSILEKNYKVLYLEKFDYKLNFTTPLEILAHMKHTGVNSLGAKHWGILEVKDFCDKYKSLYPDLTLTYSPVIVVAEKI